MKWQEARELFPDQFLLVSILKSREEENRKIVEEVAPIKIVSDEEANKEFFQAKEGTMVYHTSNKEFVINIRREPLMKVRRVK